jgi:hypothetical protein
MGLAVYGGFYAIKLNFVEKSHKGKTSYLVVKRKVKLLFASFSHRVIWFGLSASAFI